MEPLKATSLRLVLDTNQIVGAGSRWLASGPGYAPSNPHARLLRLTATEHTGLYCDEIIDEYIRALLQRGHPPDRAQRLVTYIRGSFEAVRLATSRAPVTPSDPDDEIFILCAIDGDADFLASEDRHLLELAGSYERPIIAKCEVVLTHLELPP